MVWKFSLPGEAREGGEAGAGVFICSEKIEQKPEPEVLLVSSNRTVKKMFLKGDPGLDEERRFCKGEKGLCRRKEDF